MAHVLVRNNSTLKVISGDQEELEAQMVRLLNANPRLQFYRPVTQEGGDILLKLLEIDPGTEVTEQRIVDADFRDVN